MGKNPHEICPCPPKGKCLYDSRPGVRCAPIQEEYRLECSLPQKPDFAVDHKEPIVVEWPPKQEVGQGDCEVDTGIREDLLCQIPDQITPQVVTVHGTPALAPGQTQSPVKHALLNHPLCPDAQFHMEINPPQPVKPEIRIPDLGCAVRQPMRPWRQCIENTLINDPVRRPMARWCHKRPMPPLVIPQLSINDSKTNALSWKGRQKRRQNGSHGGNANDSSQGNVRPSGIIPLNLLDRKKAQEEEKERAEQEGLKQLQQTIKASRDAYSEEQTDRAKKLLLYGKGLIKDFHSALGFSKMMQDIERSRQISAADEEECNVPICEQKCMKKMLYEINRPDLAQKEVKPKPINEKLLKKLQSIEARQKEQECEVNNEICKIKQMCYENRPELPQVYLKHVAEPKCEEISREEKFLRRREKFYEEIDEKLAVDAYIESHEKEVERQACEYAKYRLHKDLIRKQTENRLIQEKVQHNIEKSEKAAAVLVAMRSKKQKESAHDYDALKEKWESENQEKEEEKKAQHQRLMDKVYKDFNERKGVERCKWQMRDVSRLWARERLVAVENYEGECERKNERRQKAEEVALYNAALASEKKCREAREKHLNDVWGEKVKRQYFEEMQEMKDYAHNCIRDWAGKGRSPIPMHQAMKKWEYDSQMTPTMFREYEKKKNEGKEERGAGDADGYAELISTGQAFKCQSTQEQMCNETTLSTSRRLGFC
ncbi:hypothetical protein Ocin01_06329 [Orchesella cincta]|uniref:Uncharacterized protein n=1 Tax=Orchesella cincta TaxID=48709 RepID=A0A1D2N520_ORCCI|nr:hypothetical protein Ocin01_06329 [Orchesella cincta]